MGQSAKFTILPALALVWLVGMLAGALICNDAASASPMPQAKVPVPRPAGQVIVKYRLGETMGAARAAAASAGAEVVGRVPTYGLKTTGRYVVVSSDLLSTRELMKKFRADPAVERWCVAKNPQERNG